MPVYEAVPDGGARRGVVVIQEAFGVNDHIQDVTRRFADHGYHAVAPHIFHRAGGGTAPYGDFSKVLPLFEGLTDDGILADVDAALRVLGYAGVKASSTGIVGFCFGGRVTFLVALRRALGASAGFYGGGHSTPAVRRAAELCDGWLGASAYAPDDAWQRLGVVTDALERAGRASARFDIYLAVRAAPDLDLYRRLEDAGVTDLICAPWMGAPEPTLTARVAATEDFADQVIARM